MRILDIVEGAGYTYRFEDAWPMAKQWLARFAKTEDRRDFTTFTSWVKRFQDDKRFQGTPIAKYDMELGRDVVKRLNGRLDMVKVDFEARRWMRAKEDYSWLLALIYRLHEEVFSGWTEKPEGRKIIVQMLDKDVLGIHWSHDDHWVEVRGTNYWKWKADDPLHQLIDRMTGNKSDLMIGREITVDPRYEEYEELKRLLTEH